ncbi:hypothetical protein CJ030_MR4G021208 [Morella rubra]|uniref:Uncharacterized protein n=1 Tax=Morella rubra TaxID=262757 RepID=A0A6A1VWI0_9ROSI|nr:hypothetical protein CJ030_MR4G021208 [Morella rubra]
MKFVQILIPVALGLAAILLLQLRSSNLQQHKLHGFLSSPLLLFSVFNTIIVFLLFGNYRPFSSEEVDGVWPPLFSVYEGEEEREEAKTNDIGDYSEDDEDEEFCGSDGYDEDDDDDSSSDDDIFWQDEEDDTHLNIRIESFIAKMNEEWRKERLREIYCNQL